MLKKKKKKKHLRPTVILISRNETRNFVRRGLRFVFWV